jgi:hypothetical protein
MPEACATFSANFAPPRKARLSPLDGMAVGPAFRSTESALACSWMRPFVDGRAVAARSQRRCGAPAMGTVWLAARLAPGSRAGAPRHVRLGGGGVESEARHLTRRLLANFNVPLLKQGIKRLLYPAAEVPDV